MKNKLMKKNNFIDGAFITSFGIVITKLLGILYVIPFYGIVGDKGGALYGYAYSVYLVFMSISSLGIPLAISKLISEYQTLGYYDVKARVFKIGKKLSIILGIVSFGLLFFLAPVIAKSILGNLQGGNTISDVTSVLRYIAIAILIIPILSVYRGYFEGHRFMSPPSVSQVIEQLVRIIVIVFGSFLMYKVFKVSLTKSICVSVSGAAVGAFFSYLYLLFKKKNNSGKFREKMIKANEPLITNKQILKKLFYYSFPFVVIDIIKSLYSYVDSITVVKALVKYAKFSVLDAETVISTISTWGNKFNMIILSISSGIIVSLIPNLTKSLVDNKKNEVNDKITQALSILLFFAIPMTLGISFLSLPIWNLFYGYSTYGPSILSYLIFSGLFLALFTCVVTIVQVIKDYKALIISLVCGVIVKILINVNLISSFYTMGLPAYYGSITATIIGYLTTIVICLFVIFSKYKISYEKFIRNIIDIFFGSIIMIIMLFVLKFIIDIEFSSRLMSLIIVILYSLIGIIAYFIYSVKSELLVRIFGVSTVKKFVKFLNTSK